MIEFPKINLYHYRIVVNAFIVIYGNQIPEPLFFTALKWRLILIWKCLFNNRVLLDPEGLCPPKINAFLAAYLTFQLIFFGTILLLLVGAVLMNSLIMQWICFINMDQRFLWVLLRQKLSRWSKLSRAICLLLFTCVCTFLCRINHATRHFSFKGVLVFFSRFSDK